VLIKKGGQMKTKSIMTGVAIIATLLSMKSIQAQTVVRNTDMDKNTYKTAIGLRGGRTSGLTLKHFVGESTALEGIVGVWNRAWGVTGLYEKYTQAGESGLFWYYGGGLHATFESGSNINYSPYDYYYSSGGGMGLGIDGIVGLEYKIPPIPFALSLDLKPFFEINTSGNAFMALDPGIGIKVAF
jgi:hypothetical protein